MPAAFQRIAKTRGRRLRRRLVVTALGACYRLLQRRCRPGSVGHLIAAEISYGGYVDRIPIRKASEYDPRSPAQLARTTMAGGDRMLHHRYARRYSQYLEPFLNLSKRRHRVDRLTLVEIGVLRGTGLALWCDLFPDARIIGLDIDLDHFKANRADLEKRGAFLRNKPELYTFDQLADNRALAERILQQDRIDICIDDGLHSNRAVLTTMRSVARHLAEQFVYFIEDNNAVHRQIRIEYPRWRVEVFGELTVVTPYSPEG